MSVDSTLRAVQKHSETSVQNEGKATPTAFSEEHTCLKHHSALASWQQLEFSEQSLRCQPHMDVGQWKFGREKHLAEKTERGQLFISKTKRTTASVSTCEAKEKNKSAKQMAKIVMKEGGENIRVSPSHFGKNKWTEAAWIKERQEPQRQMRQSRRHLSTGLSSHPLTLSISRTPLDVKEVQDAGWTEGRREGREGTGRSKQQSRSGWVGSLSQLSPSLTHRGELKMAREKATDYSKIWTLRQPNI